MVSLKPTLKMGYKHFKNTILFKVTKGGSSSTVAYIASAQGILKKGEVSPYSSPPV
jgi:hypothetical protein